MADVAAHPPSTATIRGDQHTSAHTPANDAVIPEILVQNLSFKHDPHSSADPSLVDVNLELPKGSRTLLIGANGAGKSTLLQLLAGKRLLPKESTVHIHGQDVFTRTNSAASVTFLGTEWASSSVVRSDIKVSHFLDSIGGYKHPGRRDRLLDLLDVDLDWHMHQISDGERRRVQLVMGLMKPWDVLLLDEVTVDLDVLVRDELLAFLREESEGRGASILYATHIFDGLASFPTHIAHMRLGSFATPPTPWSSLPPTLSSTPASESAESSLHAVALQWLKEDREHRRQLEKEGKWKSRGARKGAKEPTDSETFFRKYDYSHD